MSVNAAQVENLKKRYDKEKALKDKLIDKRKDLDLKIKKTDENMKKITEDIENIEIDKTIKLIKLKGYSLSDIQDAIESGVLGQSDIKKIDDSVKSECDDNIEK